MANGSDRDQGTKAGEGSFVIISVITALFAISLVVALVAGAGSPPSTQGSSKPQCSTSCSFFLRWECPGNRFMGTCFGFSACDQPIHDCGTNP